MRYVVLCGTNLVSKGNNCIKNWSCTAWCLLTEWWHPMNINFLFALYYTLSMSYLSTGYFMVSVMTFALHWLWQIVAFVWKKLLILSFTVISIYICGLLLGIILFSVFKYFACCVSYCAICVLFQVGSISLDVLFSLYFVNHQSSDLSRHLTFARLSKGLAQNETKWPKILISSVQPPKPSITRHMNTEVTVM